MSYTLGLLSDTHGYFDPKLNELFEGVDEILHAGDVCSEEIIKTLEKIAPTTAVQGNCDVGLSTENLPEALMGEIQGLHILMLHDLGKPEKPHPKSAQLLAESEADIVIHGHSHKPSLINLGSRLFINPGSSGKKRFRLPRSAALLHITEEHLEAKIFSLEKQDLEVLDIAVAMIQNKVLKKPQENT